MPLIILLYCLFASSFTIGKSALENCSPLAFISIRMAIAGLGMLAIASWQNPRALLQLTSSQWRCLGLLALFNIYLTNALEFWALEKLPSATTCFYYSLSPFLAALLSWLRLGERLTSRQLTGLVVGFLGFLPILWQESQGGSFISLSFGWAELSISAAVFTSVFGWILLKEAIATRQIGVLVANGISMLFGGLIALGHSLISESWTPFPAADISLFLYHSLLMLIISNGICYSLYGYLLRHHSATWLSFCGFITPLATALFGYLFLQETISPVFLLSASVVFTGLFLFYQDELAQERKLQLRPQPVAS